RDFAHPNAEKAAEVDDCRTHLPVATDDDVNDPPHVLVRIAAHALAEDGGYLLVVEHHCRRTGRGIGRGGGGRCGRRGRIIRRAVAAPAAGALPGVAGPWGPGPERHGSWAGLEFPP